MNTLYSVSLSALLSIALSTPLLALAGHHDSDFKQIQAASWQGDMKTLGTLSAALCKRADTRPEDAELGYVAAYADYRIAGAGQRDAQHNRAVISGAMARAQHRLEALAPQATPYQAEALALLSSV